MGRVLKKLKRRDKGTKREEKRGRERKREEKRGKERKRRRAKDERRKGRLFETLMFMNCSRIDHELIFGT